MRIPKLLRSAVLTGLLGQTFCLNAQSAPTMGASQFSDGVHPTFDASFPDADARIVESFWKSELRSISVKVTDKKELIGEAARIPAASPDTLRILIKVEKPKGGTTVIAHIAFLTTAGYVAPDSPKRLLDGCSSWVQQRTVTLQKQVAQKAFDDGKHELDRQLRRLDDLKRDKERAENGIVKAGQRSDQATQEKEEAEKELAQLTSATMTTADSTAVAAEAKDRLKQQGRLQDRITRSATTIANAKKKTEDLQWAIKKNLEDQTAQQQVVDRQQAMVNDLQEKLQAIQ